MATLPPWLEGVNPVPFYVQGVGLGQQAAAQRNAADRAAAEMRLQAERQAQSAAQVMQELEMRRAAQQAAVAEAQQKMALQRELAMSKNNDAAARYAIQQDLANARLGMQRQGMAQRADEFKQRMEQRDRIAATKKYGQIMSKDLPGGKQAVWLEGSGGLHIVDPNANAPKDLTAGTILQIRKQALRDMELRPGEIGDEPEVTKRRTEAQKTLSEYPLPALRRNTAATPMAGPAEIPHYWPETPEAAPVPQDLTDPAFQEPASAQRGKGAITKDVAMGYLRKAGGDKAKARQMAIDDGWEF